MKDFPTSTWSFSWCFDAVPCDGQFPNNFSNFLLLFPNRLAQNCCRICIVAMLRPVEMSPNNDFHVHRNGKKDFNICVDLQYWHHRRLDQSDGGILSRGMLRVARWGPMRGLSFGLGEITGARLSCGDGSSKLFTAARHWWRLCRCKSAGIVRQSNYLWFVPQPGDHSLCAGQRGEFLTILSLSYGARILSLAEHVGFCHSRRGSFGACPVITFSPIDPQWPPPGWNIHQSQTAH